jgi:hypothetical protein
LVGVAVGCSPSAGDEQDSALEAAAAPARRANLGDVLQIRGDTVEMKMDEYLFGLPSLTLPAGRVVFQIQNLGFEGHNVEILRGDSVVAKLEHDLSPAQTAFLEVELEPGEYQLLCTVAGHDGKGMLETLTIVPAPDP